MPIRWKLTLWYSSILSILLIVFGSALYLFFVKMETSEFDRNLYKIGQDVIRSIKVVETFPFPLQYVDLPDMDIFASPEIYLQVIDTRGMIVARSRTLADQSLPLSKETIQSIKKGAAFYETQYVKGIKIRIYSIPILLNGQIIGLLQVGDSSLDRIEDSLANLRNILFIGAAITILLSASTGWVFAKRVLHPIDSIIKGASEIQKGQDLKRRIEYQGPADEIGLLISQINGMFERLDKMYQELEESYQMQKRFVSDASHELRTPLTSMRGNIDFLMKTYRENPDLIEEVLVDVSHEIERLTRLINHLLSLARADAGFIMEKEEFLFLLWMEELLLEFQKITPGPFQVYGLSELEGVTLFGNRDFLKQSFYILMENASKYSEGGKIRLAFTKLSVDREEQVEGKNLCIAIEDKGIGIPESDLPYIFSRFYRGENTRGTIGTGLGLPIAKWIIEQHNGSIDVKSKLGLGTTFYIILPIHQ